MSEVPAIIWDMTPDQMINRWILLRTITNGRDLYLDTLATDCVHITTRPGDIDRTAAVIDALLDRISA